MVLTAVERRSATLVSADAAGYSRLMAADELATIQAIKTFREAGQRIAVEHGGRLVDSPGGNLLFEFVSPASALHASLGFQTFVLGTNERYTPEDRLPFRSGVHSRQGGVDNDRVEGAGHQHAPRP